MTTRAIASQKRWVQMECGCGCHYACLADGWGSFSDSLVPVSNDTLKELAITDLEYDLQQKAESLPCPACGRHPQKHVDRVMTSARTWIFWGLVPLLFVAFFAILAALAPKAPAWTLVLVLLAALLVARLVRDPLAEIFRPDRDLPENRSKSRQAINKGKMRRQPPPAAGPTVAPAAAPADKAPGFPSK